MKKLFVALMALSAFYISPVSAEENCPSKNAAMQKYGINKSAFQLQERAEEFEYNYYKLPKTTNGKNYIMFLTLGVGEDCLHEAPKFISDQEFKKIKKWHDYNKSRRVVDDGEGE